MAKSARDSVEVSTTLQLLFSATFLTVWALLLMNLGLYLFMSGQYTDKSYWYAHTVIALLPGLMLAVAWWFVGKQKNSLQRLYLASVIAFMGFMATNVVQQLSFLLPSGSSGRVSETAQIFEPLVVFALYVAVLVWNKSVRNEK